MHQRKPNRLRGHDYSRNKLYFVTTCVQDRICSLGNVAGGKMELNAYGQICEHEWDGLAKRYSYVVLHAFVVMPDHVHGVIEIDSSRIAIGTGRDPSVPLPKIKSLSELMGVFKTTTSKQIRLAGLSSFAWQRSFYDHIIRSGDSYERICHYIHNNPAKWDENKLRK